MLLSSGEGKRRSTFQTFVKYRVIRHRLFGQVINFAIAVNVVAMAAVDFEAQARGEESSRNQVRTAACVPVCVLLLTIQCG